MQQLANEMKQARGELKRLRTDLKKFKSEERHRMGKVEAIVSRGEISLAEKTQLEMGNFKNESEPESKKTKLSTNEINENLNEKLKLSSLIATQIGTVKSPHLTKCGTPHQPGQLETTSTIYLNQGKTGKDLTQGTVAKSQNSGLSRLSLIDTRIANPLVKTTKIEWFSV